MPQKVLIAMVVNFLLWELVIRLFISSPCTQLSDKQLGYVNKPMSDFIVSSEGFSRNRFNSIGFNDDEPLDGENIERIFVVGDSYTESFQVARKDSFVQLLENGLNSSGQARKTDVIKLARDGFNPAHYPVVIDRFVGRFSPDLIILQFWAHSGGDLYSSSVSCQYNDDGQVVSLQVRPRAEDEGKDAFRNVINNSALVYYVLRRYKPYIMKMVNWFSSDGLQGNNLGSERGSRSILDMEKRISFILDEIIRHKSKMLVFYIPEPGIFFSKSGEHEPDTLRSLKVATEKKGVPFIDFTGNFKEYYNRNVQPLNGFANTFPGKGHLNCIGHKLVSSELIKVLIPEK